MSFKPSTFQQAVFDFVTAGKGSAIVVAVAGSGKTTTIVEALKRIPTDQKVTFLAFNKSIATELQSRIPRHAQALTTHSLGFQAIRKSLGSVKVDGDKVKKLIEADKAVYPTGVWRIMRYKLGRMVGLAKNHGIAPEDTDALGLLPDAMETWLKLMAHFEILDDGELAEHLRHAGIEQPPEEYLVAGTRRILRASLADTKTIDFDDMIYLPVVFNFAMPKSDWLFVDEAQDISGIQLAMIEKALSKNGRLVAVGDPHQAIYGFRGADANALNNIAAKFAACHLPLSISYRCPKKVVTEAQRYVKHILPSETAPDGMVEFREKMKFSDFQPNDMVVCRFKAPVVKLAYRLLAAKVQCKIIGRDIGAGLVSLIRGLKCSTLPALATAVKDWHKLACEKKLAKDPEADLTDLNEKEEMLSTIIQMSGTGTVDGLIAEIEALFTEDARGVVRLSTIHKAKGLEANRVFWLNSNYTLKKAKQEWQQEQENNLRYVAVTRAKDYLAFIELDQIA